MFQQPSGGSTTDATRPRTSGDRHEKMIICLTTGGEEGRDGVLRNETLLQERTREGGGGRMLVFFVNGTGGTDSPERSRRRRMARTMYVCRCTWRVATVGGTGKAEVVRWRGRRTERGFSTLLGGSVRPSGSASSAWSLRRRFRLHLRLQQARASSP